MAYSKQNFQDGQILTAANLEKMENGIIAGQGAHNLLDNSDFRNPVNQRGKTSYTANGHTIDRWRDTTNMTLNVNNGSISLVNNSPSSNAYLRQRISVNALTAGIAYTMAINIDGTIYIGSAVIASDSTVTFYGKDGLYLSCTGLTSNAYWTIQIAISAGYSFSNIRWAALYEGSYDASTLPAYQPKGYAAELAECQRYYQFIPEQTSCAFSTSAQSNKYFASSINFPQMRIAPTVSLKKDSNGYIGVVQGVAFVSASEFDFAYKLNGTLLPATTNANYAGKVMSFYGIELNADL